MEDNLTKAAAVVLYSQSLAREKAWQSDARKIEMVAAKSLTPVGCFRFQINQRK
jgi:hypothetical protein